MTKMHSGRT